MTSDTLELSLAFPIPGGFAWAVLGGVLSAFVFVPFIGSVRVIAGNVLPSCLGASHTLAKLKWITGIK